MGNQEKPEAQLYVGLLHSLLDDLSLVNGVKNTQLDKEYITHRTMYEGFSFLTKTLPLLGKAVDTALETGTFVCPSNFRTYKHTALPSFLKGLLQRIFTEKGQVREDIDVAALTEVRQVLYFNYKVKTGFSALDIKVASRKFCEVDAGLPYICYDPLTGSPTTRVIGPVYDGGRGFKNCEVQELSQNSKDVLKLACQFLRDLFLGFDPKPITPFHGPGATASGEKPHEKRIFHVHYEELHRVYPYYRYFYINPIHLLHTVRDYHARDRKKVAENKVLFVNKDSRGPRTIACEPLELMFCQQGLRKLMYDHIETHPLTASRINFTDQSVNQQLALLGSCENFIATIDMKDASDSVSWSLVQYLFKDTPLVPYFRGTRSVNSILPDGRVVELKKFAAMGSALCFPVEALVFYALIIGTYALYEHLYPFAYVYGDDLIIDREIIPTLNEVFQEVGLKINLDKSFYNGPFRESCGKDYFKGDEVTTVKLRSQFKSLPDNIVSLVETANHLFDRGYYKASEFIQRFIKRHWNIPFGLSNSPYLCYYSNRANRLDHGSRRWNPKLQFFEHVRPVVSNKKYESMGRNPAEQYGEYFRKILTGWDESYRSGHYARRHSINITKRYIQVGI